MEVTELCCWPCELKPTEDPATAATAATAAKGPPASGALSLLPVGLEEAELDNSELVPAELLLDTLEAAAKGAAVVAAVEVGSAAEAAPGWADEVEASLAAK